MMTAGKHFYYPAVNKLAQPITADLDLADVACFFKPNLAFLVDVVGGWMSHRSQHYFLSL